MGDRQKTVEDCIEVVEKAGFGLRGNALTVRENNTELKKFYSMVLAFVLTLPVFVFSMILGDMYISPLT